MCERAGRSRKRDALYFSKSNAKSAKAIFKTNKLTKKHISSGKSTQFYFWKKWEDSIVLGQATAVKWRHFVKNSRNEFRFWFNFQHSLKEKCRVLFQHRWMNHSMLMWTRLFEKGNCFFSCCLRWKGAGRNTDVCTLKHSHLAKALWELLFWKCFVNLWDSFWLYCAPNSLCFLLACNTLHFRNF